MKRSEGAAGKYRFLSQSAPLTMTPDSVHTYIDYLKEQGRVQGTIDGYRHNLKLLYDFLPADKCIRAGTLLQWRAALVEQGYSPRTANARISAVNSYLAYYNRRDLQVIRQLAFEEYLQPEMTRAEYLRLLQTAREQNKERLYLLIKLFGTTGLPVQALGRVTAEAVRAGAITTGGAKAPQTIRLPRCLQKELLSFAAENGVQSGPLFLTRAGKPLSRTNVADSIRHLCRDARVPEEKGNPRCLRRLYEDTRRAILNNITALLDQTYDHLLENEQARIGWAAV